MVSLFGQNYQRNYFWISAWNFLYLPGGFLEAFWGFLQASLFMILHTNSPGSPKSFHEAPKKLQKNSGQKSRNNFVVIFVQTMKPKGHFEINWPLKVVFFRKCNGFVKFPKKIQITILTLKFKFPAKNSKQLIQILCSGSEWSMAQDSDSEYFFGEITFWIKATFSTRSCLKLKQVKVNVPEGLNEVWSFEFHQPVFKTVTSAGSQQPPTEKSAKIQHISWFYQNIKVMRHPVSPIPTKWGIWTSWVYKFVKIINLK